MKWVVVVTDIVGKYNPSFYLVDAKSANSAMIKVIQFLGETASSYKFMVKRPIELRGDENE